MTYLGGAPVAVVAPDGLSVAAAVEGASVIPSLSGHGGRRGGKRRTIAREKGKRRNRLAPTRIYPSNLLFACLYMFSFPSNRNSKKNWLKIQ